VFLLLEKISSLTPEKAYEELRRILFNYGCKIVSEDPPRSIKVEHGVNPFSVVISTPRNVLKIIEFYLTPLDNKTRIIAITTIHPSYWSFNIIGYIVLIMIGIMMIWIASFAWIFTGILTLSALILFIAVPIGVLWDIYLHTNRDVIADEILRILI
jgi:hypothetical protein